MHEPERLCNKGFGWLHGINQLAKLQSPLRDIEILALIPQSSEDIHCYYSKQIAHEYRTWLRIWQSISCGSELPASHSQEKTDESIQKLPRPTVEQGMLRWIEGI